MNDPEIAYLAGFFDGEGCILIQKSGKRYWLSIMAGQINPAPLKLLATRFGGRIQHKPDSRGFRSMHAWRLTSLRARDALEAMLPYLTVKRAEAELAIQFQERLSTPRPHTVEALTEEWATREALHLKMKALKRLSYEAALDGYEQQPRQSTLGRKGARLSGGKGSGIERPLRRFPHKPERLEQIREWRRAKVPWKVIADRLGISEDGAKRYTRIWGMESRP